MLIALALAVVLAMAVQWWSTNPATPAPAASNARRPSAKTPETVEPSDLVVRLDELKVQRTDAEGTDRNPFRFKPKPPPPPPPAPPVAQRPAQPDGPPVNQGPPPPPPIPLKFIGTVEPKPGDKVAAFSDCRYTFRGREGEVIDGRYRLVRIGVESVVMEYVDGRGRTTIRLSGQDCVGK
jgi:hypothetical protein